MASLGNQHCANCIGSRHTCVPDLYRISPPGTHGLISDDLFLPLLCWTRILCLQESNPISVGN